MALARTAARCGRAVLLLAPAVLLVAVIAPASAARPAPGSPATAGRDVAAAAAARPADDDDGHPAPPQPVSPYADCTDTTGVPFATGLPALPCLTYGDATGGQSRFQDFGAVFGDITQVDRRAALRIPLQAALSRVIYTICNGSPSQACPAGFDVELPDPVDFSYFAVVAAVYVQSPLGSQPQFGSFAPTKVTAMAFGSIPVTAVVTISQARRDGTVIPLQLVWGSASNIPAGTVFGGPLSRYGPAPEYPDGALATLFPVAHVTGPVVVTVSDVRVDGVGLDVGSTCSSALSLDLTAPGGWQNGNLTTPVRGEPGQYNPFYVPSFLTSEVDIPAFTGCRGANGQDVSALVSGLVSGRDNHLDLTQLTVLSNFGCLPTTANPETCYLEHPATVDPTKVPIPTP